MKNKATEITLWRDREHNCICYRPTFADGSQGRPQWTVFDATSSAWDVEDAARALFGQLVLIKWEKM